MKSLADPHRRIGVKQATVFPISSTTIRLHTLSTVTANASGICWFLLRPASTGGVLGICNTSTATSAAFSDWNYLAWPGNAADSPAYNSKRRVVSAALTCWLTTPYLSSSG